jgi:hypothetical protein
MLITHFPCILHDGTAFRILSIHVRYPGIPESVTASYWQHFSMQHQARPETSDYTLNKHIMYYFVIKHLGHYTLFAKTNRNKKYKKTTNKALFNTSYKAHAKKKLNNTTLTTEQQIPQLLFVLTRNVNSIVLTVKMILPWI